MAFNYSELTRIKEKIEADTETLTVKLKDFSALIESNVDNPKVWAGTSAGNFMETWNMFATENFPEYKKIFNKEITNLSVAIEAWRQSEGQL